VLTGRATLQLIKLDEDDMNKIDGMDKNQRLCNKPDESGRCYGWTAEQYGW
jgi:glycerol 2-dehydrogenase (NADP+)